MLSQRQWLHRKFFLPMDRPLLRDSNALRFESARTSPGGKLQNVHQGVKSSGVRGGQQHLIWGEYTYFHYMQVHGQVLHLLACWQYCMLLKCPPKLSYMWTGFMCRGISVPYKMLEADLITPSPGCQSTSLRKFNPPMPLNCNDS